MITGALKNKIDSLWLDFHSGGITNPLSVIEQISYLMFARMLDIEETRKEKQAQRSKKDFERLFSPDTTHLRWSHLKKCGADEQFRIVTGRRDESDPKGWKGLFEFFREDVAGNSSTLGRYLEEAQCAIPKASLLTSAINKIDELPLVGDKKGDLYEYLLSKLTTAGIAGQFRTPRHIIRAMVEILDIQPQETVCDPACGTAGFLVEVMHYLKRTHSSPELVEDETEDDGETPILDDHGCPVKHYPGDLLAEYREHISEAMFSGFDFDSTMLRIAAMNMLLHGIEGPRIEYKDSLSEQSEVAIDYEEHYDVVLANPPFKGSIDHESVFKGLTSVAKTKKTELLFLVLMERLLKKGGRCAVIVPDGVLFGSSTAHKAVRRMLVDENELHAVICLPSGVFKPYAGVSTAILVFAKGQPPADHAVWFYDVEHDGYSLDDKRDPVKEDDIPDLLQRWRERDRDKDTGRSEKAFFVPVEEIRENKFDLSINRYKEIQYEEVEYDPPKEILAKLRGLEDEIRADLDTLEQMLK